MPYLKNYYKKINENYKSQSVKRYKYPDYNIFSGYNEAKKGCCFQCNQNFSLNAALLRNMNSIVM